MEIDEVLKLIEDWKWDEAKAEIIKTYNQCQLLYNKYNRLREALEWYASNDGWIVDESKMVNAVVRVCDKAKEALKEAGDENR
jgi:hypothetical protein